MLKSTLLVAFAAISLSAMAQDAWKANGNISAGGKSHFEIRHEVLNEDQYLSGGDAYDFEAMLDRMPSNVEDALISGLFCAHRQAVLIREQTIASMIPAVTDGYAYAPDAAAMAEETENSMRPMRMVMEEKKTTRDLDYDTSYYILATDLNQTQRNYLSTWWTTGCTDHQKDIVVRLLKIDAMKADEPIYLSSYTHHTYDIVPIP